jgi:dTDP-4-dehydrorhamnose 3,5-epimerase
MKVTELDLPGVKLIEPKVFRDDRGHFLESYREARYREAGIPDRFVQDNLSYSSRGVLRGLHLQHPRGQAKLVSVLHGEVFDVAVDVRVGSETFGRWTGHRLSADNARQMYVPAGFAHGFLVLSETALFAYKCSDEYVPEAELSIRWDDPAIGIEWPLAEPTLSPKDADAPLLEDVAPDRLPRLKGS